MFERAPGLHVERPVALVERAIEFDAPRVGPNSSLEPVPSGIPGERALGFSPLSAAATSRRGVIAMLPPVEDQTAARRSKSSVHREAALAMSQALGEDDEYDIPAFLRRNAE